MPSPSHEKPMPRKRSALPPPAPNITWSVATVDWVLGDKGGTRPVGVTNALLERLLDAAGLDDTGPLKRPEVAQAFAVAVRAEFCRTKAPEPVEVGGRFADTFTPFQPFAEADSDELEDHERKVVDALLKLAATGKGLKAWRAH